MDMGIPAPSLDSEAARLFGQDHVDAHQSRQVITNDQIMKDLPRNHVCSRRDKEKSQPVCDKEGVCFENEIFDPCASFDYFPGSVSIDVAADKIKNETPIGLESGPCHTPLLEDAEERYESCPVTEDGTFSFWESRRKIDAASVQTYHKSIKLSQVSPMGMTIAARSAEHKRWRNEAFCNGTPFPQPNFFPYKIKHKSNYESHLLQRSNCWMESVGYSRSHKNIEHSIATPQVEYSSQKKLLSPCPLKFPRTRDGGQELCTLMTSPIVVSSSKRSKPCFDQEYPLANDLDYLASPKSKTSQHESVGAYLETHEICNSPSGEYFEWDI